MQLTQSQIKNGWKVVKLGEIATFNYGKSLPERNRIAGDFPVYASAGKVGTHSSFLTKAPAIVVGRKGNVGATYFVKENFYTIDTAYFIEENKNYNLKYLYYQLGILHLKELNTDSAVPGLNREVVYAQLINLPPLATQEKIAGVLGAYDDLIENNDKRIKVLEAMAQKLYTEWFVNFKFPGYQKVKMVDSGHPDFGMIPEGWEVKSISEIGKVITGKTPSTANRNFFDGNILFIKTPDIHGNIFIINSDQTLSDLGVDSQKTKTLPEKTVFVSCIGTLGSVAITSKPSQTNQQINAVILNNPQDYIFLYFFLTSSKKQLINLGSNGATMGNVNKDKFEKIELLVPSRKCLADYNQSVIPYFDKILNLQKQNQNLKKSRDFLIPQLVGGRVEIK